MNWRWGTAFPGVPLHVNHCPRNCCMLFVLFASANVPPTINNNSDSKPQIFLPPAGRGVRMWDVAFAVCSVTCSHV